MGKNAYFNQIRAWTDIAEQVFMTKVPYWEFAPEFHVRANGFRTTVSTDRLQGKEYVTLDVCDTRLPSGEPYVAVTLTSKQPLLEQQHVYWWLMRQISPGQKMDWWSGKSSSLIIHEERVFAKDVTLIISGVIEGLRAEEKMLDLMAKAEEMIQIGFGK